MSLFMLVTCGYAMEITEFFKYDGIERPTTSQEKRADGRKISENSFRSK